MKFTLLALKLFDSGALIARHTGASSKINFSAAHPFA
jgi:hypothetical protein